MSEWKIINHNFKCREGDSDAKGGCTLIGGTWKDVHTNELFKNKKVIFLVYQVRLHQLVPVNNYQSMMSYIRILKIKVLMMFIVYQ